MLTIFWGFWEWILRIIGIFALACAAVWAVVMFPAEPVDSSGSLDRDALGPALAAVVPALIGIVVLVPALKRKLLGARFVGLGWLLRRLLVLMSLGILFIIAMILGAKLELFPKEESEHVFTLSGWAFLYSAGAIVLFTVLCRIFGLGRDGAEGTDQERGRYQERENDRGEVHGDADSDDESHSATAAFRSASTDWRERVSARHDPANRSSPGRSSTHHRQARPVRRSSGSFVGNVMILLLLGVAVLGSYGNSYAQFIPEKPLIDIGYGSQHWIFFFCGIWGMVAFMLSLPKNGTGWIRSVSFRSILGAAVGFGFGWSFGIGALTTGLPALHSALTGGTPADLRVSVLGPGRDVVIRGCDRHVWVKAAAPYDAGDIRLCNAPVDIFDSANAGQELLLVGHKTQFGFRYAEITK